MSTATAVARETAWLRTSGDGLPALLVSAGGPWQIVQGFWPGAKLRTQLPGIYVLASPCDDLRVSNQRIRPQYAFELRLNWPILRTQAPVAETEAQNLANAADLLIQRIRGLVGDKTHGGRFLSVAENPRRVTRTDADPEMTIPGQKALRSIVTYRADDLELNG